MKNRITRLCVLVAVLAAATFLFFSARIAYGQSGMLSADIPFDFYVGSQKLAAGRYMVSHISASGVVRVYNGAGHVGVSLTNGVSIRSASPGSQLIFNKYEHRYFLTEVRWEDYSSARQLLRSKFETEIAKNRTPERIVATSNR
jgi:hypothetical protein